MDEIVVKAKLSRLRISPRKVRLVADLVRGKSVEEARHILKFTVKAAAQPMAKLLESAVANASHNFKLEPADLMVRSITVDEGPILKRFRPESRGRVARIQKKTSHINIVLGNSLSKKTLPKKAEIKADKVKKTVSVKKAVKPATVKKTVKKTTSKKKD
jgi:large subunit ribosomal protein L22